MVKHKIPTAEQSSVSSLDSWILVFLSAFHFAPFAFGITYKYVHIYLIYALTIAF